MSKPKPSTKPKRIVVISDLHCGHQLGLTPPRHQGGALVAKQKEFWAWYAATAREIGRVDLLVANGDLIDGNATRNGGVELLTSDRHKQADMAAECLEVIKHDRTEIVFGTPYHSGAAEDFERAVAEKFGAGCGPELVIDVDGTVFQFKHHISTSGLWHGRATAALREQLNDILSSAVGMGGPRADVVIRSHAHYYVAVENAAGAAYVTPCMQLGSGYGARKFSLWPDVGLMLFEVAGGSFRCEAKLFRAETGRRQVCSL